MADGDDKPALRALESRMLKRLHGEEEGSETP